MKSDSINIIYGFAKGGEFMSLYEYLKENYGESEPILISDIQIKEMSATNLSRQIKKLEDEGKIKKYDAEICFIPKQTMFKSGSIISRNAIIEKKYLKNKDTVFGYISGIMFANWIGLTTQVPAIYEIVTNRMIEDYQETSIASVKVILHKSRVTITEDNYRILQFLDLLEDIDSIVDTKEERLKQRIFCYMKDMMFTFSMLEPYLPYYQDKLYRNMYEVGVLSGVSA